MNNVSRIAKGLGLKDVGEAEVGVTICKDCKAQLRLGIEKLDKEKEAKVTKRTFAYCPECRKIVYLAFEERFPPGIKVEPHDD